MKHTTNTRRGRNRGNGRRHLNLKTQTFESSGPDGKIRGTAQQVLDRYLTLGRDAASAGDPVAAEGFYQFAEHYYRVLHAADGNGGGGGGFERTLRIAEGEDNRPEDTVRASPTESATDEAEQVPF
jgi:hypothetical protein